MTSQIRVDEITNRSGLGTVTIYDNGFEFTGVTTFTEDVDITGGLTIGGVLTYEDVTNIDSVGVVTARAGINISGGNLQVGGTTVINSGRVLYNLEQIKLADAKELVLGSGNDLSIQHSGSHSLISHQGLAGALKIRGDDIRFEDAGGTEALRIDDVGRLLIGRTSVLASSAERLTINDGMAMFRRNNNNAAAVYIRNEDTTADTRQPYLIFTDGGGNRGGFGVQYNESSLWISGQNGIAFRTSGSAPSQEERLRITSAGLVGIGENSPDRLLHLKAASSTAYSGGSDTADYNFLKIENTTNDKSAGIFFQIGGNGEAAITATEVADGNTDIAFQNRGGGVRSEKVRITSDGKMGVGTASPNHKLTLHDSTTGTFDALNITSGLTNAVGLQLGINSASNAFFWHTANGAIQFATNNVERMRVTNNGITFNGDTAAANALDDYEEGSWTPQLLGGTSNPSLTYSAQSGGYEKVGNLVHLAFFMHVSAVNSQGSGYLELHGLPYIPVTSPLGASEVPALVLQTQPFGDGKAANRFAFCRTVGGSSRMFVGYRDLTTGNAIIPTNAAANISTGYFIGHITYRAA